VDSGFEIQRRAASGNDYTTIAIVGIQERQYADNGLSDGTTYVYRVLTLSGGDRTGYSNEAVATTPRSVSAGVATASGGGGGGGCFISAAGSGRHLLDPTNPAAVRLGAAVLLLICGLRALCLRNLQHRTWSGRPARPKRAIINRTAA
jgi:hypothetical protein